MSMLASSSPTQNLEPSAPLIKPRRVLFVDHTAALGGGEIALLNLVNALDQSRFTPVVALFSDGDLRQKLIDSGVEVHVLPLSSEVVNQRKDALGGGTLLRLRAVMLSATFALRLAKFIRRQKIDLVHTNSLKSDLIGGVAGRLARRPVVWHVRDRIADDYLPARVAAVFRFLARVLPTHVLVNSAATGETLAGPSPSGRLARHMTVVHDGTFLQHIVPALRTSPGALIGLVGRITRWKGQHVFIEAAAKVIQRFPQARFQIIGSAMFDEREYESQIRQMVIELGLSEFVEFTGFRKDVTACIANLDILVHASIVGEPFGQVVIEGMSAAKPVVATRGGGVPEIVIEGVSGLLVPMGDSTAMAEAILSLLGDPQRALELGLAARERVKSQFTVRHTAANVETVYKSIL